MQDDAPLKSYCLMNWPSLITIGLFVLVFPVPVFAIPPPDIIISLMQTFLSILGAMTAFLMVVFYLFRDLIVMYSRKNKKTLFAFLFITIFIALFCMWYFQNEPIVAETSEGEMVSIREIIEPTPFINFVSWEQKTFLSMYDDFSNFFSQQGIRVPEVSITESFTAKDSYTYLQEHGDDALLLDVREEFEQTLYGPNHPQILRVRYGDIANGNIEGIPKDKKLIVICYSGLRGYLTSLLLKHYGFEDVAFVRKGLSGWQDANLPTYGDDTFIFISMSHRKLTAEDVQKSPARVIDFSRHDLLKSDVFPYVENFAYEYSSIKDVAEKIEAIKDEEIILMCQTESSCFDATNFAYLFEQAGGKIIGYFDDIKAESDGYQNLSARWSEFWKNHPQD